RLLFRGSEGAVMWTRGSDVTDRCFVNKQRHQPRPKSGARPANPSSWIAHHRPAPLLGRAERLFLGVAGVALFVSVAVGVANRPSGPEACARALEATAPTAAIHTADDPTAPVRAPIVTPMTTPIVTPLEPLEPPQDGSPAMTSITSFRPGDCDERGIKPRA